MSKLLEELEAHRKNIKTDSYSMSIGELINLYKDGDIKLDPAFQRLFRWKDVQKTAFIESILLGIPIPEIFLAQNAAGKWTVVDGVQRTSTILQLVNKLAKYPPLKMTEAKYLTSLDGMSWDDLPEEAQRIFKRAKISLNIILTEQSIDTQYELFQRLNTGGTHLEDQEVRNCLIIMMDIDFYNRIDELKNYPSFKFTLQLTDKKYEEEYHMELILRYLIAVAGKTNYSKYSLSNIHIGEFLDKETRVLIESVKNGTLNLDAEISRFKLVFDWLDKTSNGAVFKAYNSKKDTFDGGFSTASFEAIAPGVALNFDSIKTLDAAEFKQRIKDLCAETEYQDATRHGTRAPLRFKMLTNLSKEFFSK